MHIGCSGLECSFQRSGYPVNARRARSKATSAVARRVAGISMEWENESERFRVLDFIAPLRALRQCSSRSREIEINRSETRFSTIPRKRTDLKKQKREKKRREQKKREKKRRKERKKRKRGSKKWILGRKHGSISASLSRIRGFGMRKVHFPR